MATSAPAVRELLDDGTRYEKAGMLDRALELYRAAQAETQDPVFISESLRRQAHTHRMRCEWDEAIAAATRSAAAAEEAGSPELLAEAWNAEAAVYQSRGEFDAAIRLYRRMLDLVGSGRIRAVALQNLAAIDGMRGMLDRAEAHFREAHAAFEQAGDRWGMGYVLNNLGRLALDRGDAATAEAALETATDLAREVQDLELIAIVRVNYAEALLARGESQKAEVQVSAALGHFVAAGNDWRRVECLRLLGHIARQRDQKELAGTYYEAALNLAAQIGAKVEREQLRVHLAELCADSPVGARDCTDIGNLD